MIERERKRVEATGKEAPPAERALTPVEEYEQQEQKRIGRHARRARAEAAQPGSPST